MGRALVLNEDARNATDVLTQALTQEGTRAVVRASAHAWRSFAEASRGDLRIALHDAEEAVRTVDPAEEPEVLADALTALITAQVWLGRGLDRGPRGTAIEVGTRLAPTSVPRPDLMMVGLLARTGEWDEARSLGASLLDDATAAGDEEAVALLRAELGWVAYLEGDWESSLDHLSAAIRMGSGHPGRLGMLALVEAGLGQVDASRTHATQGLEASARSGSLDAELFALSAFGALERSLGNTSEAHGHLERAWRLHQDAGVGEPAMFPFVSDHVGVLLELGAEAAADEVVSWLEERGGALDRPWAMAVAERTRAALAAAHRDFDEAFAGMDRALLHHQRFSMPLELGRTLMILGSIRRRDKQKRPAREPLQEAIAIFERLPAPSWVESAQAELSRIGGRRAAGDELTEVERRVATLAVAGRTNREIADTLFMSVRTVEGHLSHIYRKLGIRSRTELGLFWDPDDDPSSEDDRRRPAGGRPVATVGSRSTKAP